MLLMFVFSLTPLTYYKVAMNILSLIPKSFNPFSSDYIEKLSPKHEDYLVPTFEIKKCLSCLKKIITKSIICI